MPSLLSILITAYLFSLMVVMGIVKLADKLKIAELIRSWFKK